MKGIKSAILTLMAFLFCIRPAFSVPFDAKWYDVSEYLLGRVFVKVIYLESNKRSANTENWTDAEKRNCRDALEKALGDVRRRFIQEFELSPGSGRLLPGVELEFLFDYETVEVSVEPITMNGSGVQFSTGDVKLWVNEVMAAKGFAAMTPATGPNPILPYPSYQYNVAQYADRLRRDHGTDWAVVVFFYDNSADEDGEFANHKSAGPPMGVGGPGLDFSNNRGRPFTETNGIIHEFLHLWYAVDEHTMNQHFREDAVAGYLAGANRNYALARGYNCVMYSVQHWPEICPFTKQQIGWTDSDGDRIPDILDVPPRISLSPVGAGLRFEGKAFCPPLPNRNPYSDGGTIRPPYDLSVVLHLKAVPATGKVPGFAPPFPWQRSDITLNRIVSVEYRLRQGGKAITQWARAEPLDGSYDQAVEGFAVTLESLGPGDYTLETRCRNSVQLDSGILSTPFHVGSSSSMRLPDFESAARG